MPSKLDLSEGALELLRLHFEGGSLKMGGEHPESLGGRTVEATRGAYRELVRAGLMEPIHTFALGSESRYRLTDNAITRRTELLDGASTRAAQSIGAGRGPRN